MNYVEIGEVIKEKYAEGYTCQKISDFLSTLGIPWGPSKVNRILKELGIEHLDNKRQSASNYNFQNDGIRGKDFGCVVVL